MEHDPRDLFGRERELAETDVALAAAAAGTPQALLVGGDAGIGKTSLLGGIKSRARAAGFVVLEGHCLDIESGESLAPVREALQAYVTGAPPDALTPVVRRLSPWLSANVQPSGLNPIIDLRLAVDEVSGIAPLVLVLEDLHWADQSTQDFAVTMARTMQGAMLLVLTYRTDDLTRRHPVRKALMDIGRCVGSRRLELGPLDRAGIAGIIESATGSAEPAYVGTVLARSEGNPLYAEELLAGGSSGVPAPLSDLLLARVEALSDHARDLLRLASVGGSRIDPAMIGRAAGAEAVEVEACLREAIDANVLSSTDANLDFRHGLLQEAVYDDLMPEERARMHAQFAAALQDRIDPARPPDAAALGQMARHWFEAHELAKAFAASVRAGSAVRGFHTPEGLAHLERALALWNRMDDPEGAAGMPKADLLRLLARSSTSEPNPERSLRFIREALRLLEPDGDRLLASRVYSTYAEMCNELSDDLGHREAAIKALELADGPATPELAAALRMRGWLYARAGDAQGALDHADRAVSVAREVGSVDDEAGALYLAGQVLFESGECRAGLARIREAIAVARDGGFARLSDEFQASLAWWLMVVGETDAGISAALEGRRNALAGGFPSEAGFNGEQLVDAWRLQGRLDEADLLLDELHEGGMDELRWRMMRVAQLVARGEFLAALPLELENMELLDKRAVPYGGFDVIRQVDLFCGLGDVSRALAIVQRHLAATADTDSVVEQAMFARAAFIALTEAATAGTDVPTGLTEQCTLIQQGAVTGVVEGELARGHAACDALLASALAHTLAGTSDATRWRAAEEVAARIGAYHALRPQMGLAQALLDTGERDEARLLLLESWQSAHDMGARWFESQVAALARRNRIATAEIETLPRQLAALTPREREVLDVLATGATNRVIAERLFISEKTVSVHVTNLLAKLGKSNRGEAAALARQLSN